MTRLTKEQTIKVVETIVAANESVRGTEDYYKYHMQHEVLIEKMSYRKMKNIKYWYFVGHYIPAYVHQNDDVIIYKKIKDTEWLYYGEDRFMLSDEVKDLFK